MSVRTKKQKTFVLDTNVILRDFKSIFSFKEHDIVIHIAVIKELENFKKGNEMKNVNAREFARFASKLPAKAFDKGAILGKGLGKIRIVVRQEFHKDVEILFPEKTVDDIIINAAYVENKEKKNAKREIVLVSQDMYMCTKAKSLGIKTEGYKTDSISDESILTKGVQTIKLNAELSTILFSKGKLDFLTDPLIKGKTFFKNEFLILKLSNNKEESGTRLAVYKKEEDKEGKVIKNEIIAFNKKEVTSFGIEPKNSEQAFALYALLDPSVKIVSMNGKAGSGKTFLSIAAALEKHEAYDHIFYTRHVIPVGGKEIGFLPGDISDKVNVYMEALYDNLGVIKTVSKKQNAISVIDKLQKDEKIKIQVVNFMRGRTLPNRFFIIDEAQNLTPQVIKTIISRAGEGAKFILIGDTDQIDDPYLDKKSNGLSHLIDRFMGQGIYAHINFIKGERSELATLAGNLL
ncbi:MAG: PhoH family protein [Candidatus Nomurabacteria bacterium]|nr:PhoH family protein [Candidatus Nomurabacteria bacterium]